MVSEEYFKKLEAKYVKYWYVAQAGASDVIELAREIAKYTDDEKKVTRIVNGLRRGNVHSIEDLMRADIDALPIQEGNLLSICRLQRDVFLLAQ